jgi:Ion channel
MEIKSLSGVISEMMVQKIKEMPKKLYSKWRTADLFSSIFGVLGIITATAGYERGFSPTRTHDNCEEFPNETDRFLTLILTIISMIFLIKRHQLKSRWKQKRLPPYSANISKLFLEKKSFLSIRLFIELLILGIFPYPYIKGELRYQQANLKELNDFENYEIELCYTVSEILYILMFSRFFFLLRTVFNFTPYQDDHARYNCRKYKTRANVRFSVRCMMKTHPFMIIYGISFFSFLLLGVLLRVCERPYTDVSNLNFESFENSIWNTGITMATIGFGDLYPSTILGRVIGITCAMWGGFVFSMIVFTFESMLELDTQQYLAKLLNKSFIYTE